MQDWIVLSVKSGWTPKEALLWIFPSFWSLMFDIWLEMSKAQPELFVASYLCVIYSVVRGKFPFFN